MKRHVTILAAALLLSVPVKAEKEFEPLSTFTWGIRAGFAATGTYVSDASINGLEFEEYTQDTQVGNFLAVQCRLNSRRLFLQSGLGLGFNRSTFTLNTDDMELPDGMLQNPGMTYQFKSIMLPIQAGCHIINQSPYCLSLFTGPRLRFLSDRHYETSFSNFAPYSLNESPVAVILGWTFGMSVQISRTFLDFEYEAGIGNISDGIHDSSGISPSPDISLGRRFGVISFSYGIMF